MLRLIEKKVLGLILLLSLITGCSEFALLSSGSSLALSNNTYAKAYSGIDFATTLTTDKDIKTHAYYYVKKAKDVKDLVKKVIAHDFDDSLYVESVQTISVEESIIYQPDKKLIIASIWNFTEEETENNRKTLKFINQTGFEFLW